jgi:hypothetical protein
MSAFDWKKAVVVSVVAATCLATAAIASGQPIRREPTGAARISALEKQVADLQARTAALEAAQRAHANERGFTKDSGGNWSFSPTSGSVAIGSATGLTLTAHTRATLEGQVRTDVKGPLVVLNGGTRGVASQGGQVLGTCPGGPAPLPLSGGKVAPSATTVLVP